MQAIQADQGCFASTACLFDQPFDQRWHRGNIAGMAERRHQRRTQDLLL